jgi:hypothetical protein
MKLSHIITTKIISEAPKAPAFPAKATARNVAARIEELTSELHPLLADVKKNGNREMAKYVAQSISSLMKVSKMLNSMNFGE